MKIYILIISLCIAFSNAMIAQTTASAETAPKPIDITAPMSKGDIFYKRFDFDDAIKAYEKQGVLNLSERRNLAKSYANMDNLPKAEENYAKLVEMTGHTAEDVYAYAQSLLKTKKTVEAQKQIDVFHAMTNTDKRSMEYGAYGDFVGKIKAIKNKVILKNLKLNTEQQDFGTGYYKDQVVYASSNLDLKLMKSNWLGNNLSFLDMKVGDQTTDNELVNISKFKKNKKYHEGPASFNADGTEMAFTRNDYKANGVDGTKNLELCTSVMTSSGDWSEPVLLHFNNKDYSCGHPALTPDGKTMFFASDMPGGKGGTDIYKIEKNGETWGNPINLTKINTEGNEMFPFYHQDGFLFFASNGHPGLGGLDIFGVRMNALMPTRAINNLGAPLNTNKDDFALIIDKTNTRGYLSSNREGGHGDDDIYSIIFQEPLMDKFENQKPAPEPKIIAKVDPPVDPETPADPAPADPAPADPARVDPTPEDVTPAPPVNIPAPRAPRDGDCGKIKVIVKVIDRTTREPIPNAKIDLDSKINFTDENGITEWIVNGCERYIVNGSKKVSDLKSYYFPKEELDLSQKRGPETINVLYEFDALEVGKEVKIENILYDLDKFFIRPDAAGELARTLDIMKAHPTMKIEMGSHTDCRMPKEYNMTLSINRAKAAAEYLIARGISASRMTWKGYGETKLTNGCACEASESTKVIGLRKFRDIEDGQCSDCTKDQHQTNRRTTFKIISF
jgi:outer membrane protein OmpA-like peptidoglycan-associated protein